MKHRTTVWLFYACIFMQSPLFAQWESLKGPFGGIVFNMPHNNDYVYAYTLGGIYRSGDAGLFWEKLSIPQHEEGVGLLSVNGGQLLASSNHRQGFQVQKFIHISTDNGDSWTTRSLPDTFPTFFDDGGIIGQRILLLGNNQIWESADGGQTWIDSPLNADMPFPTALTADDSRFYVTGYGKFAVSGPGGLGYTIHNFPNSAYAINIDIHGSLILAYDLSLERYYRSTNDGQNWVACSPSGMGNSEHQTVMRNDSLFTLIAGNLAYSTDDGAHWAQMTNVPGTLYESAIGISKGVLLSCESGRGILRSVDPAGPWKESTYGLFASNVVDIEHTDGYIFAGVPYRGLSRFDRNTGIWDSTTLMRVRYDFTDICTRNGKIYALRDVYLNPGGPTIGISNDNGNTWSEVPVVDPHNPVGIPPVNVNRLVASNDALVTWLEEPNGFPAKTYISHNDGASWQTLPLSNSWSLTFITNGDEIWGGTTNGVIYSPDNGISWENRSNGLIPQGANSAVIFKLFKVDTLIFAVRGVNVPSLFVSRDNGLNWQPANNGLPPGYYGTAPIGSILRFNNQLLAFCDGKIYRSPDEGLHWVFYPHPVPDSGPGVSKVIDGELFCAIYYNGIWRADIEDFTFEQVTGKVYYDDNNNGILDAGETGVPNIVLRLNGQLWTTDADGNYALYSHFDGSDQQLEIFNANLPHTTFTPSFYTLNGGAASKDFAVYRTPGIRDLSITMTPIGAPRPGFQYLYYVNTHNIGTTSEQAATEVVLDGSLEYVDAVPAPSQISGDTLRWQMPGFDYLAEKMFRIKVRVPAPTPIGTLLTTTAVILPVAGDIEPANNTTETIVTTVGAFDPNDKFERHGTKISRQAIDEGEPLEYTIRFQNTGNYPAEKVIVTDQLSAFLDASTIQVLAASHPFTWTVRSDGYLSFDFDMINLPDSSDQLGSQGFVKFAVNAFKETPNDATIANFASIYFDFNDPVKTNLVNTTISTATTGTVSPENLREAIRVLPNPGSGYFQLSWPAETALTGSIQVVSQGGGLVWQGQLKNAKETTVDLSGRPDGLYFALVKDSRGRLYVGKLVLAGK